MTEKSHAFDRIIAEMEKSKNQGREKNACSDF